MKFLILALCAAAATYAPRPEELQLERALPIDGLVRAEPSGLAMVGGVLYCVSDNHTDDIYKLTLESDRAVMEPVIPVGIPDGVRGDFEGIVGDGEGGFYLASETEFRILHVPGKGKPSVWVTPSLQDTGKASGLFRFPGAFFEGIALLGPNRFALCAERQPRGLMYVEGGEDPPKAESFVLMEATVQPRGIRFPDFTDLCHFGSSLYALERNAEIISTIERDEKGVRVVPWRSFRETVDLETYRYVDRRFGMAEGLAFDATRVYVVLDNNGVARESNKDDARPILFIFRQP
ncbi:MAG TPA: esterase-like activity of phytase family protein [Candidatus Hydrogenedentes bacterium]|nr:esterase-like activity of phytase family protein [Candidatus Hydrogenedentota bacterium]